MVTEATSKYVRSAHHYPVAKATKSSQPVEALAFNASTAATTTKSVSTVSEGKLNSDEDGFFYNEAGVKLEVKELAISYDAKEWLKHVKETKDGSIPLCCIWATRKNGRSAICGYSSKKHLVKRHVENTHL